MSEQDLQNQEQQQENIQQPDIAGDMKVMSALAGYEDPEIMQRFQDRIKENEEQSATATTQTATQQQDNTQQSEQQEQQQTTKKSGAINISELPEDLQELILASQNEGFDYQKYNERKSKQKEIQELPAKDFLSLYYKSMYGKTEQNPNGLTDEEIQEEISTYSPMQIKIQHNNLLSEYNKTVEQERAKVKEQLQSTKTIITKEEQENLTKNINETIERNKDKKEIAGVPLSEADVKVLPEFFKSIVSVNSETGTTPLDDMLQDDDFLYEVAGVIYKMKQGGFKKEISDMKESIKQNIFDKLGLTPEGTGTGVTSMTNDFDITKLV
jgi:hypothetical protein